MEKLQSKIVQKPKIQFIDLKAQQARIRSEVDRAITEVLDHGVYIMGPEVHELESQLSEFCGAKYAISCANGTDALALGLMAKQVGPGDAVLVPSFTFASTAEVVAWVGATPVFVDVLPDTFNLDPESLKQGIKKAKQLNLKTVGVIAVDIFGQPADYDVINAIAKENKMWVMADAAQSFGATYKGQKVGTIGDITTTSFFPAKPLGCYGDGGAIFTDDEELAHIIKSLRVHGQGDDKYDNVRVGMNGRLDTIQAAILLEKLKIFPDEILARNKVAEYYHQALKDTVTVPHVPQDIKSVWAQYTVQIESSERRQELMANMKEHGVPTVVYYVKPLHMQKAYKMYPMADENLKVSESVASRVLSLPMHPYLSVCQQDMINELIHSSLSLPSIN